MQSVSYGIWTCVAVSISYDDNHYTTGIFTWYRLDTDLYSELNPILLYQNLF